MSVRVPSIATTNSDGANTPDTDAFVRQFMTGYLYAAIQTVGRRDRFRVVSVDPERGTIIIDQPDLAGWQVKISVEKVQS